MPQAAHGEVLSAEVDLTGANEAYWTMLGAMQRGLCRMDAISLYGGVLDVLSETPAQILIADDEPAIRQSLRLVLEDEGYPVLEAANGAAALDLLLTSPVPLVVLLDMRMPGLSGLEVLLRASADPARMARHAIAIVSASPFIAGRPDPVLSALLARYSIAVLQKPFDLDALLALVARLWERVQPA